MKKEIKLFEAFAGIGTQYQALKNISKEKNWEIKTVGIVEWFIPAIIGYQAIHHPVDKKEIKEETFDPKGVCLSMDSKKPIGESSIKKLNNSINSFWLNQSVKNCNNLFDIRSVGLNNVPKNIDIFTYSFPCQDISHQGKQRGFDKNSNSRSSLLWEVERILNELYENDKTELPNYLLLENVKAIANDKNKDNLKLWLDKLEDLGYDNKVYGLTATDFGSAQNRERVFVLSVLKTHAEKVGFEFTDLESIKVSQKQPISKVIDFDDKNWNEKYSTFKLEEKNLSKGSNMKKFELMNYTNFKSENLIYDINYSGPTLTASGAMARLKLYFGENQIRDMSAKEAFRYMGFKDQAYNSIKELTELSSTKMIYTCGNSISIEVLEAIFKSLKF
ncbi:MAG: DNA (cytosine-5-)-methyltransferase [Mycoplasma sp.]